MGNRKRKPGLNPADAFRREERQREKKKNRLERQRLREEALEAADPSRVRSNLDKLIRLRSQGQLSHKGAQELQHLQRAWDRLVSEGKTGTALRPVSQTAYSRCASQPQQSFIALSKKESSSETGTSSEDEDSTGSSDGDSTTDDEASNPDIAKAAPLTVSKSSIVKIAAQAARKVALERLGVFATNNNVASIVNPLEPSQCRWHMSQRSDTQFSKVPQREPFTEELDPAVAARLEALRQDHERSKSLAPGPRIMNIPDSHLAGPPPPRPPHPIMRQNLSVGFPSDVHVPPPPPLPPPPFHYPASDLHYPGPHSSGETCVGGVEASSFASFADSQSYSTTVLPYPFPQSASSNALTTSFSDQQSFQASSFPETRYLAHTEIKSESSAPPSQTLSAESTAQPKPSPLFVPTALRVLQKSKKTQPCSAVRPTVKNVTGKSRYYASLSASATAANRAMISAPTSLPPSTSDPPSRDLEETFRNFMEEVSKSMG